MFTIAQTPFSTASSIWSAGKGLCGWTEGRRNNMKFRLGLLFCAAMLMAAAPVWADHAPGTGDGKDTSSWGQPASGAAADVNFSGWGSNSDDYGTNWILKSRERRLGEGPSGNSPAMPEPGSLALVLVGLAGVGLLGRRRGEPATTL